MKRKGVRVDIEKAERVKEDFKNQRRRYYIAYIKNVVLRWRFSAPLSIAKSF